MADYEYEDMITHVVKTLKEPVRIDPNLDRRVMLEIERLAESERRIPAIRSVLAWLRRRRTIQLSPLGGLTLATGVAALVFATVQLVGPRANSNPVVVHGVSDVTLIQFVLVAPGAQSVTVAGDFNDWNVSATALARENGDGVWWVTVPLAPGRYRYAFLIDGKTWLGDPNAPTAEDEFGRPNSVVTIAGA